jgi:hypothetical protein
MEHTLIGSKVKMNIKGFYVTVGYISTARLRSKHGKLFYGDIVLNDKYSKFQEINVIGHDYNYEHALEGKRVKIIDIVTYIEGID